MFRRRRPPTLEDLLTLILERQVLVMGALENLQAAQAAVDTAVAAAIAKLGEPAGVPEADVQAVADDLNAQAVSLSGATNPPTEPPVSQ